MLRIVLSASLLLALSLTPDLAQADAGPGAWRLSLDERPFGVVHYPEAGDADVRFGFLGGDLLGLIHPVLTLGVAYQIDETILIGSRVGAGYQETNTFFGEIGALGLIPFIEILFGDGDIIPFVGGEAGFQLLFVDTGPFGGLQTEGFAIFGGMGGAHFFLADGFSVSPALALDFLYFSQSDRAGWQLSLLLSFEGWIGGSGARSPAPARAAEPAASDLVTE